VPAPERSKGRDFPRGVSSVAGNPSAAQKQSRQIANRSDGLRYVTLDRNCQAIPTFEALGAVMLTRIYIDNYRCFSNFEWKPERLVLISGKNGSGKTRLAALVYNLANAITNDLPVSEVMHANSYSRWDSRREFTFEMDVSALGRSFRYRVVFDNLALNGAPRVRRRCSASSTSIARCSNTTVAPRGSSMRTGMPCRAIPRTEVTSHSRRFLRARTQRN
jgi:hypothetical protein